MLTFDIDLDIQGSAAGTFTAQEQADLQAAAALWESVIVGDLPDVVYQGQFIDDIRITATLEFMDGPGDVLAVGGFEVGSLRPGSLLPAAGFLEMDVADRANDFLDTAIHEIGHALGFGTAWGIHNLVTGGVYTGTHAGGEYNVLFELSTSPPVIPIDGGHWSETYLRYELMTSQLGPVDTEPLSRITVGAMADLGYTVDYGGAEIYSPLWQNLAEPLDVDNSGLITLHDAVILVAFMRENGVGFSLPVPPTIPFVPELEAWYDVDSNEIVTINDSLLIISHLRNQQASSMAPSGQAAPLLATVQESFEAKLDELRDLSTTLDAAHRAQVDSQMPQFDPMAVSQGYVPPTLTEEGYLVVPGRMASDDISGDGIGLSDLPKGRAITEQELKLLDEVFAMLNMKSEIERQLVVENGRINEWVNTGRQAGGEMPELTEGYLNELAEDQPHLRPLTPRENELFSLVFAELAKAASERDEALLDQWITELEASDGGFEAALLSSLSS